MLLTFDPEDHLQHYVKDPGLRNELAENIFRSNLWLDLDRGLVDRSEVISRLSARYPRWSDIIREAVSSWEEMLEPIPGTVELLRRAREAGLKIFLLSNFPQRAYENTKEKYDFLRLTAGEIISARVGVIKPDERIYSKLIEKYQLDPSETFFIDDNSANVEAACRLGMAGVVFEDPPKLRRELKDRGVFL